MSVAIEAAAGKLTGDRLARRNVLVLAAAQALAGANNVVIFATGGLLGSMLAPDKSLATLPISVMVVGIWAGTLPVGFLARRYGRRLAYLVGTAFGCLAGLLGYTAIMRGSFGLYVVATFCGGLYAAAHNSYRFAAADTASPAFRPKAVSWVLAGGLFAAILGAQLVIFTKDALSPFLFAVSYLAQAGVAVVAALVLLLLHAPRPSTRAGASSGRPLAEIARQPRLIAAIGCGVASYALMNFVMTSAPLAMVDCGHSVTAAALGQQWHVVGMYAPSFFTGTLITRFGVERVTIAGLLLIMASAVVGLTGITVAHFWGALILLGLGWNFGFVGATTMVTECHRPEERNKVQAFNDFLVFGSMALGSFLSGTLLAHFGWGALNAVVFPTVLAVGVLFTWYMRRPSPQQA